MLPRFTSFQPEHCTFSDLWFPIRFPYFLDSVFLGIFSQWDIILPLVHKLIKLSREAIFSYCINHLAPRIHFQLFPVSSSFDAKVTSQIFQISYLVSTTYLNCKLKGREIDCFNMQGPLGSFNGHTPLWRPFFLGVLWLVISVKGLCKLFKQNPKHHFQNSQVRKAWSVIGQEKRRFPFQMCKSPSTPYQLIITGFITLQSHWWPNSSPWWFESSITTIQVSLWTE